MNIWFITTGSSDVQLKTDKHWGALFSKVRNQLGTQKQFSQTKSKDSQKFLYPARVMGVVYGDAIAQYYNDLDFPLLDNFWALLELQNITPQRIIVLVTDQSQLFKAKASEKNNVFSPYWQDTCTLEPLLKHYLDKKSSVVPEFLTLEPEPGKSGLDNWNDVLNLVQNKLKGLINIPQDATVYVSHQAGTPAISSAVQFASLAKFGDRVKFLVSSEQDKTLTDTIESSAYLRGIKKGQAKELLAHHDYTGIKELLFKYLDPETQKLLDAAIQWNFAEFDEFKERLKEHPQFTAAVEERTKEKNWWWMSYEAAYLGVVRLEQENTVEAMFHSFRALEGLVSKWSIIFYPDDINDRDGMPVAILKVPSKLPQFLLDEFEKLRAEKPDKTHEIKLYGQKLFTLLQETKMQLKDNEDIKTLCQSVRDKRNQFFHRLKGLDQKRLFQAWGMNTRDSWEKRILSCLNLISEQNEFKSLTKASLMAQVHKELKRAIDNL